VTRDQVKLLVARREVMRPGRVPPAKSLTTNIVGNIEEMQLMVRSRLLVNATGQRSDLRSAWECLDSRRKRGRRHVEPSRGKGALGLGQFPRSSGVLR
jgi:hypothetical protein